jgi:hypothetical protein
MDNHEDINRPLRDHKTIDRIGNAKNLIPTYSERLIRYIEKHDNKLDEFDFIKDEIKKNESLLEEKNQFTYGVKWRIFEKEINTYLKFLEEKSSCFSGALSVEEITEKTNNYIKIYCVERLTPELFGKLRRLSKKDKTSIIHLLTGINERDSYDYFNRSIKNTDWVKGFVDGEIIDKIDELKSKLI